MQRDLMDILACPLCKSELRLDVQDEQGGEVLAGTLTCTSCNEAYPIEDGIPNLLPPDLRAAMAEASSQGGPASGHDPA